MTTFAHAKICPRVQVSHSSRRPSGECKRGEQRAGRGRNEPRRLVWLADSWANLGFLSRILLAAGIISVLAILGLMPQSEHATLQTHHYQTSRPELRYLQLVIPTDRMSDVTLCKTILTAQILNYPVPILIPWGNSSAGLPFPKRARIQSKIGQIHKYFASLPAEIDDAITILLDGPDTWFQLRADQLLKQYYRLTARANEQLGKQYGPGNGLEQKLLFAAHTQCSSKNDADLACSAVPESYGDDVLGARYMGHGAIIGKTRDIRAFMRRTYDMVQKNPPKKLITTYSQIFGQQENARQALRNSTQPAARGFQHRLGLLKNRFPSSKWNAAATHTKGERNMETSRNMTHEFGIGLDYAQALGVSAALGADKIDWRTQHPLAAGMDTGSTPPFWTVSGREDGMHHSATWSDVSLLTVRDTDTIPAMIHHMPTAPNGADSSHLRSDWWKKLWFQPHARALYTNAEELPATAVASVMRENGQVELYWNIHTRHEKAGAWLPSNAFLRWQDMCGGEAEWKSVFDDDGGPWKGLWDNL